jgi:carbohydrate esterase-like sialic acid-specific acetylesterase
MLRRSLRQTLAAVLFIGLVFVAGAETERLYPLQQLLSIVHLHDAQPVAFALNHDNAQESPTEVGCPAAGEKRLMVALLIGQSNAANYGETRGTAPAGVVNFYRGKCYATRDPLLGADGNRGSVWTRMATTLIARRAFNRIVLVPIAVGGTTIDDWTPGGMLHARIETTLGFLAASGLSITHVVWHQGESDATRGTPPDVYRAQLQELVTLLRAKTGAKVFVSRATICGSSPNAAIRTMQQAVIDGSADALEGVDTDQLGAGWRYDGCHFSTAALERAGELWADLIEREQDPAGAKDRLATGTPD